MTATSRLPVAAWISSLGAVALLLVTAPRYGFHRDELYFVMAGRNLDWGFVDQPPLTPLIARASELLIGTTPLALRILPALSVGLVGLLVGSMAKTFGARRNAQVFAAFTGGWVGVLLGEGHLLSTAVFDYLAWTVGLWLLVRILAGADQKLWLALGVTVGVGLQNKHTILFFAVAVLVGLIATRQRKLLANPWPWLGVGIATLIALPNIVWQARNGWPQLEMAGALRDRSEGPLLFVLQQPGLLSLTLAIPAVAGLWWLARADGAAQWRPVAVAYGVLFVGLVLTGGKSYYIAPMYSALLAAGAVWFDGMSATGRRWVAAGCLAGITLGLFVALPLLPAQALEGRDLTGELSETVGWPELVEQVRVVYETIPMADRDETVIFTGSYGEAGAIDVLGPGLGLPSAASGHNSYWHWGPPVGDGPIIGVGYAEAALRPMCPGLERVATISNPYGVSNEEAGLPIVVCLEPSSSLAREWPRLRHYN